ncbi:hypothetical protein LUX29_09595 [Aureimonas altamirensis]|uniref:hypothetical protein n=1 Tax=Aureimonas altamirensis TaxID=370622 RepID=UPI001E655145|nr:hypothetical protein [Aureimonas altamirensis]UHD47396.1 hypothetical protein LUX29_09595 [Aureimonas altamirensis]
MSNTIQVWEDGELVEKPIDFIAPLEADDDLGGPGVPQSVTIRQAKLQMSRAGILSAVDAAIAGMEGQAGEEARIEWQYATELRRAHPLVEALGPTLGLTNEAIDALFVEAAKIA